MDLLELNEKISTAFNVKFQPVIKFTCVDDVQLGALGAKVRYEPLDVPNVERGVYVVVFGEENAVYVGSFTRTLTKRWLYARGRYVYHHMRERIAKHLGEGGIASLWLVTEDDLKTSVPSPFDEYVNVQGVEAALRRLYDFECNSTD